MKGFTAQLARDSAVYGISTVVQRLLTFLLTPLYTNVLLPAQMGDVAQLYSLMALASVVALLGFEQAFLRYWVDEQPVDALRCALGGVLASSMAVVACGMLGADTISRLLLLTSPRAPELVQMAMAIVFLDSLAAIPFALLRIERRAFLFALVRIIVVVVNVALNIVLVALWQWNVRGVLIAGIVSSLVGVVATIPFIVPYVRIQLDWTLMKAMLRFGLPTVPAALAAMVLQVADRPILGWLTNQESVGIYNANYRLAIPMMLAVSVFETAWKPLYLQHAHQPTAPELAAQVMGYYVAIATGLFVVWTTLVGEIVAIPIFGGHLIGTQYWTGLPIIPIVMAGYFALGLSTTFAAGLVITKKTGWFPLVNGSAAIANIVLNFALVPVLGYIGAAWATFGAYSLAAVGMYYASRRYWRVQYRWSVLLVAALLCSLTVWAQSILPRTGVYFVKLALVGLSAVGCWVIVRISSIRKE